MDREKGKGGVALAFQLESTVHPNFGGEGYWGNTTVAVSKQAFRGKETKIL